MTRLHIEGESLFLPMLQMQGVCRGGSSYPIALAPR